MSAGMDGRPVVPSSSRLRPLGLAEVEITGGFWGRRQEVNSEATIGHCHEWMERLSWVGNFQAAAEGRLPEDRNGVVFTDSDVYKLMEAAAWEVGRSGSPDADRRFTDLTAVIAPVQEEDGYLNTVFGRPGQPDRYSDLEWGHELYCYGHMLQAAVARARTGRADEFVEAFEDRPFPVPGPVVSGSSDVAIPLTPYHDWANRGPSTMRVWMPVG